jgi:hypothetical protein
MAAKAVKVPYSPSSARGPEAQQRQLLRSALGRVLEHELTWRLSRREHLEPRVCQL